MKKIIFVLCAISLVVFISNLIVAQAQQEMERIVLKIKENALGQPPIANAKVTCSSTEINYQATYQTNQSGECVLTNLPFSEKGYSISCTVEADTYKSLNTKVNVRPAPPSTLVAQKGTQSSMSPTTINHFYLDPESYIITGIVKDKMAKKPIPFPRVTLPINPSTIYKATIDESTMKYTLKFPYPTNLSSIKLYAGADGFKQQEVELTLNHKQKQYKYTLDFELSKY